jgi:hypothetical protein
VGEIPQMGSPWAWGNIGEVWTTDVCGLQGENRQRRGEGNDDDSIDLRYIDFEGAVGSLSIDGARSLVALRALRALLVQGRTFLSFLFSLAHFFFFWWGAWDRVGNFAIMDLHLVRYGATM